MIYLLLACVTAHSVYLENATPFETTDFINTLGTKTQTILFTTEQCESCYEIKKEWARVALPSSIEINCTRDL